MGPIDYAQALSSAFSGGFWLGLVSGAVALYVVAVFVRWWRERA